MADPGLCKEIWSTYHCFTHCLEKLNIQISTLFLPYWFSVGGNNYGLWSLIWWRVWNFSVVFQSGNCLMASGNYVRITWKRSRAMSHVTLRQNINMLFTFVNISFRALINRVRISILCIMLGIDSILTLRSKFTQTNLQHPPFLYLRTSFKKLVNFTNTFSVCSFHTFL